MNDVFEAETELLALTCETTKDSALNSGFKDVTIYGDFKKAEYTVKSPAIVLVAKNKKVSHYTIIGVYITYINRKCDGYDSF